MALEYDESERRVALLHKNLERHGTIYNTLASSSLVSGEIIAKKPWKTPVEG